MCGNFCIVTSDGRNQIAISIQSRFESQRRFDSNIARFDSSTMRFDTDSIQILTIRFKRHAIWTEISKSWLKLNTRSSLLSNTHYSVRSSDVWFYQSLMYARNNSLSVIIGGGALNGEINARKSASPKMEIPMVTNLPLAGTNKIDICLLKPFCCFGIWDLIWDLEFEDSRFWSEIRFKVWDLAWRFESPVKKIWEFRVRFDLRFAHHWWGQKLQQVRSVYVSWVFHVS